MKRARGEAGGGLRRALWIAADLCTEPPPLPLTGLVVFMMLVFLPFQIGFVDGSLARARIHDVPAFRQTLSAHGAWPALAVLALTQGAVFARRQRRELEPLLAAPVSALQIVGGYALPSLALCLIGPLIMFPATMLGYRVLGGEFLRAPAQELFLSYLLVMTAGLWMTAAGIAGALRARHVQSLIAYGALGYAALLGIDATTAALRAEGAQALAIALTVAACIAGAAALACVAKGLDRERLIRRP